MPYSPRRDRDPHPRASASRGAVDAEESVRLMLRRVLTPLQQRAIQRLRDAGYEALADRAKDRWERGKTFGGVITMPGYEPQRHRELMVDLIRADAQVTGPQPEER